MFEPPILDQLMGVGALLLGFAGACRHIKLQEQRNVTLKNKLLKIEKMELEGRHIYEDMRMKYRANRRKWGARYV